MLFQIVLIVTGLLEVIQKPVVAVIILASAEFDVPLEGAAYANAHETKIEERGALRHFLRIETVTVHFCGQVASRREQRHTDVLFAGIVMLSQGAFALVLGRQTGRNTLAVDLFLPLSGYLAFMCLHHQSPQSLSLFKWANDVAQIIVIGKLVILDIF